jgi:hypothetical protein
LTFVAIGRVPKPILCSLTIVRRCSGEIGVRFCLRFFFGRGRVPGGGDGLHSVDGSLLRSFMSILLGHQTQLLGGERLGSGQQLLQHAAVGGLESAPLGRAEPLVG